MRQLLAHIEARHRPLAISAALLLLCLLIYAAIWLPFSHSVERLSAQVSDQRALETWMHQAATQVAQLRGTGSAVGRSDGRSLLALVDQTAKQSQLGSAIRRVEPDGEGKARIHLEQAAFDDIITWLEQLSVKYGIHVDEITVDRLDRPGLVNARVSLQGTQP
jgi:general secretion pathway protein M